MLLRNTGQFLHHSSQLIQEEQLRIAEELLQKAASIGRTHGIPLEQLQKILKLFYEEGD